MAILQEKDYVNDHAQPTIKEMMAGLKPLTFTYILNE